eukprot:16146207-Heterocapsa_arctica.AAC.1
MCERLVRQVQDNGLSPLELNGPKTKVLELVKWQVVERVCLGATRFAARMVDDSPEERVCVARRHLGRR